MADAAYIDPKLTWSVPAKVTAETGMDALTHCIEAYTNKFAHPLVDMYALMGIKLIAASLEHAVTNGKDLEAREAMALGSMYGGLCLGPVNTAAVHALSYPTRTVKCNPPSSSYALQLYCESEEICRSGCSLRSETTGK